jgi:O-antigen/teichoic acid export membrane protein
MKKCSYCGVLNEDASPSCVRCRTDFSEAAVKYFDFRDQRTGKLSEGGLSLVLFSCAFFSGPIISALLKIYFGAGELPHDQTLIHMTLVVMCLSFMFPLVLAISSLRRESKTSRCFALVTLALMISIVLLLLPDVVWGFATAN